MTVAAPEWIRDFKLAICAANESVPDSYFFCDSYIDRGAIVAQITFNDFQIQNACSCLFQMETFYFLVNLHIMKYTIVLSRQNSLSCESLPLRGQISVEGHI